MIVEIITDTNGAAGEIQKSFGLLALCCAEEHSDHLLEND